MLAPTCAVRPLPRLLGHWCFACGSENPIGLKLTFGFDGTAVVTQVTLGREHGGWEGIAHGGILATVLDEVMAWSVVAFAQRLFVTRRLSADYLRPAPVGQLLTARAALRPGPDVGSCLASALITGPDGRELVRGRADFALLDAEKAQRIPANHREAMQQLFDQIRRELGIEPVLPSA